MCMRILYKTGSGPSRSCRGTSIYPYLKWYLTLLFGTQLIWTLILLLLYAINPQNILCSLHKLVSQLNSRQGNIEISGDIYLYAVS